MSIDISEHIASMCLLFYWLLEVVGQDLFDLVATCFLDILREVNLIERQLVLATEVDVVLE